MPASNIAELAEFVRGASRVEAVDLSAFRRVVEYHPEDMTITVETGMTRLATLLIGLISATALTLFLYAGYAKSPTALRYISVTLAFALSLMAKTMAVTNRYDLGAENLTPAGLALDAKNHILFAACRNPAQMVILNALTGKIITTLRIGTGVDGAG